MPEITFVQHDGREVVVTAEVGDNLMQVARDNDVEGVIAECGGACACSTCHIVPDAELSAVLAPPEDMEAMTLEGALNREERSRLACQIEVIEAMNGIRIVVPETLL